ncbi:MAG: M28 family peptidase [Gemmatimonadaceae bacterium]|nr:M28 family peptidase [Gemmatimonadaceae bacterium]
MIFRFALSLAAPAVITACAPFVRGAAAPSPTSAAINVADVRSRIFLVAHDSMRGRQAGYTGNYAMTSYLAREARRIGLEPAGEKGTYFQTVPVVRRATDSTSTISVHGRRLAIFTDFAPVRPTSSLRAGLGLSAKSLGSVYGGRAGDTTVSLAPAQVEGRMVVLDAPLGADGMPTGVYSTPAATAISRFPNAAAIAVAALEIVTPAAAAGLTSRSAGLPRPAGGPARPTTILLSTRAAESVLGSPLASLRPGATGRNVSLHIAFDDRPTEAPARNVVALLRGSDPRLKGQVVAVGAHSDHNGIAARAVDHDSLRAFNRVMRPEGAQTAARQPTGVERERIRAVLDSLRLINPPRRDSINNGADDDGSGSVAALEIAESLAADGRPRRSILFVWHTGEEAGLLGSAWFNDQPTIPRDSIIAQLNMDMVGRGTAIDLARGGPRNLQVIGSRRLSTELGNVVDSVNALRAEPWLIDYSFDAPRHPLNRYCRSDHYMYARAGIPITYFSRGYHIDYHQVTDEPQYINYEGLARVAAFVRDVAIAVANRDTRVRVDKPKPDPLGPCRQ